MTKSLAFTLCFLFICTASSGAPRRSPGSTSHASSLKIKKAIDQIIPPKTQKSLGLGLVLLSAEKGDTLFELGADQQLIPASVNKVFTAYSALKRLRPTSTFKTTIHTSGSAKDGRLIGDLYIRGGGDPSLVSERLWMLINELVRSGIKNISGNLIADSTYYDQERTPETRPKYLKDQAYNAPIGALSFNFNTTTIYVRPGEAPGKPPIVYTDPENSYIDVVNQATTGTAGSKPTILVSRTSFVKGDIGDTVLLRGSVPIDGKEFRFYRNIVNPSLYTAHMFRTFWEQRGLKLDGNVLEGAVPESARQILEFESLPLWQIVWGMNKFSNNFVADQILKKVGAEAWGTPGTLQKGVTALQDTLEDIGIPKRSYSIFDGSGLTRDTRVTTRQIAKVLLAAYQDFAISSEFVASLGIASEDGTLRNRFSGTPLSSSLRAKTGTLDGVSALAGYCPSADGELLAFAILLNDNKLRHGKMTGWVDKIAIAFSKYARKG